MLDNSVIVSKNVEIYSTPTIKMFDESEMQFFFVPYQKGAVMGEIIALYEDQLKNNMWILIGHGDWETGMKISNPLEPGIYMPLSHRDINTFKPAQVFLGHVHKPIDDELICYPGSPCGLDITETGKRRFLIFNTDDRSIEPHHVSTDVLYFSERFSILPLEDEETYLREKIRKRINEWDLTEEERKKTLIRIKIRGYSTDKRRVKEIVEDEFKEFQFYSGEQVDVSEVYVSTNLEREEISRKVANRIKELPLPNGVYDPSYDDILFHALKVIYGEDSCL